MNRSTNSGNSMARKSIFTTICFHSIDGPGAPDMTGYYPRDEERAGYRPARDTEALNASYERFLRTGVSIQIQTYGAGPAGEPIRPAVGGNAGYPVDDRSMMAARGMDSRNMGYGGGMPEPPLPPDASNTLYIEGIPTGCTRREPGGDPIVLCFVDFAEATQAAIALDALQGETDELDIQKLSKLCFVYTKSFVRFTS
ncbi:hypothetical protein HU200_056423 [Digitaria exilis]|uniref:RRM domain-containing protein n=1 Tax=Digitaria exilis TaxID=1010633 RepID=A0A835ALK0_9POAL|nr:hypothetical protein HU200_056423 [Digitaria exilis]